MRPNDIAEMQERQQPIRQQVLDSQSEDRSKQIFADIILKPVILEHQHKMQMINSFIKLQDGGQSFLEELPSELN